jgi:ABC-type transport system substrate-binding protein
VKRRSTVVAILSVLVLCVAPLACCSPVIGKVVSGVTYMPMENGAKITWGTDTASIGWVEYGLTDGYGTSSVPITLPTTTHVVELTGLESLTTYHYCVVSADGYGNKATSVDYTFTTLKGVIILAISNCMASNIAGSSATITWGTNLASSSLVEYGITTGYSTSTTPDTMTRTDHSVLLTGLASETTYHYRVKSVDEAGVVAVSDDYTFTTPMEYQLNVGVQSLPSTNNPFLAVDGEADAAHIGIMYEPLVHYNNMGEVLPLLAESWDYDDDTMKWTITLDPDAKFSNGTQVTAYDVKFSLLKYMALGLGQTADIAATIKQNQGGTSGIPFSLEDNDPFSDTIESIGGNFIADGFSAGEMVEIRGTTDGPDKGTTGDQDGAYLIYSVTPTVITLDPTVSIDSEWSNAGMILTAVGPDVDAITVLDDTTLTIELETFAAMFMSYLSNVVIVPESIWGGMTNTEILVYENANPIGSGAWTVRETVADTYVIYEAHADYWGGAPKIDVLAKIYYGSDEQQKAALGNGDIDATASMLPRGIVQLLDDQDLDIYQVAENTTFSLYLNHRVAPFNFLKFRQALNVGIDRMSMMSLVTNGWAVIPQQIEVAPHLSYADLSLEWPYVGMQLWDRINTANDLLDDIPGMSTINDGVDGIRTYNGEPLVIELICMDTSAEDMAIAGLVEDSLADMGIEVGISALSLVEIAFRISVDIEGGNDDWDAYIYGQTIPPDYDYFASQWGYYENVRSDKRSSVVGWDSPEAQAIGEQLNLLQTLPEGNATRDALIAETQWRIAEELPCLPLYHPITPNAYRIDRFTGWIEDQGVYMYGYVPSMIGPVNLLSVEPIDPFIDAS